MSQELPFFHFNISAKGFLARAENQLAEFDKTKNLDNFFYSALELRFGIEARLNEYLIPALKSINKNKKDISEYVASKLLKQLTKIDPDAERSSTLKITCEQDGRSTTMQFTPVSQRLASIHGQLGELLHFKFFVKNEHWSFQNPLHSNPNRSIADYVPLLQEGLVELRYATSGTLLSNPRFQALVKEVVENEASNNRGQTTVFEQIESVDCPYTPTL